MRRLADQGNATATDESIQLAAERADLAELQRLSDTGNATATAQLIETATELADLETLRLLARQGSTDAAEALAELIGQWPYVTEGINTIDPLRPHLHFHGPVCSHWTGMDGVSNLCQVLHFPARLP